MPSFFPGSFDCGVRLRSLFDGSVRTPKPGIDYAGAPAADNCLTAHNPLQNLAAGECIGPDMADFETSFDQHRPLLFPIVLDRSTAAIVVHAPVARRFPVPVIHAFQSRIDDRRFGLSSRDRTYDRSRTANENLVVVVYRFRNFLRNLCRPSSKEPIFPKKRAAGFHNRKFDR